jgi:hypothetical protein
MPRLTAAEKAAQAAAAAEDARIAREVITDFYADEVAQAQEKLAKAQALMAEAQTEIRDAEQRRDAWTATGQLQDRPHWPAPDAVRHYTAAIVLGMAGPILRAGGHLDEATRAAYESAHERQEATDRYLATLGHPAPDLGTRPRR